MLFFSPTAARPPPTPTTACIVQTEYTQSGWAWWCRLVNYSTWEAEEEDYTPAWATQDCVKQKKTCEVLKTCLSLLETESAVLGITQDLENARQALCHRTMSAVPRTGVNTETVGVCFFFFFSFMVFIIFPENLLTSMLPVRTIKTLLINPCQAWDN